MSIERMHSAKPVEILNVSVKTIISGSLCLTVEDTSNNVSIRNVNGIIEAIARFIGIGEHKLPGQ